MDIAPTLAKLFVVSFFLNLLWEILHSSLYTTCNKMPLGKLQRLLTFMSLKDAFWITLFYVISTVLFGSLFIFQNPAQLAFFILLALTFSFIDERISLKMGRWEYAPAMPTFFSIGVTPLLELAVTGTIALAIVLYIL
jgi:hypothetical protein